ncbi:MAG: heavy-metal-associated domain-containing protein [Elusimicrobia bacterium]|nr:heavy-metal-associated domain-containing protein [Elusimicrobiota bacterium]
MKNRKGFALMAVLMIFFSTSSFLAAEQDIPPVASTEGRLTGRVQMRIEGMACPFCAYGVEKHLKKVRGVEEAKVNLGEGTAAVTLKPGAEVTAEQVRQAVRKAGFKASEIKNLEGGDRP